MYEKYAYITQHSECGGGDLCSWPHVPCSPAFLPHVPQRAPLLLALAVLLVMADLTGLSARTGGAVSGAQPVMPAAPVHLAVLMLPEL